MKPEHEGIPKKPEHRLSQHKTFILKIEAERFAQLAEHIIMFDKAFAKKPEFHMTIIGYSKGELLKKIFEALPELEEKVNALLGRFQWQHKVEKKYFHVAQDVAIPRQYLEPGQVISDNTDIEKPTVHRESIVQMLDVPDMQLFYTALKELLEQAARENPALQALNIPIDTLCATPPPHVTIYSYNGKGIGINSLEEWNALQPQPFEF